MNRRRSRALILAAACAALVLRLAFAFLYWTDKPLTHDEREYLVLAESIAAGRGFTYPESHEVGTGQRFSRSPGYPAVLSLLRLPAGATEAPGRVKLLQSVLGAIAVLLIAAITRRVAGEAAAAIGAWLAALHPSLATMPAYAISEALYLPLAMACVLLLMIAGENGARTASSSSRQGFGRSIAAGLAVGVSGLVRGGMLVFLPLATLWLAWRRRPAMAAAFALTAAVVIAPWTVRNFREHGRFIAVASEGGVTFWTGNHPLARGEGDLAANPELKRAEIEFRAAHPGLTAEQLEPLYYRDALRQIRERPAWWLMLLLKKAFYTVVPIGPSYTLHSPRYLFAAVVPYATLAPLAFAGFLVASRRGRSPEPLYLLAASVVLTSLIFFPQERFRLTVIDPLVIVGAAAAFGAATRQSS